MRALRLSLASSASRHVKPVLPNARNIRQFSRPSSPVVGAPAAVSSSLRSSSSASQPRGLALLAATSSASSARHTRFLKEKECFRRYLASMIAPEEPSSPESTTPYLAVRRPLSFSRCAATADNDAFCDDSGHLEIADSYPRLLRRSCSPFMASRPPLLTRRRRRSKSIMVRYSPSPTDTSCQIFSCPF